MSENNITDKVIIKRNLGGYGWTTQIVIEGRDGSSFIADLQNDIYELGLQGNQPVAIDNGHDALKHHAEVLVDFAKTKGKKISSPNGGAESYEVSYPYPLLTELSSANILTNASGYNLISKDSENRLLGINKNVSPNEDVSPNIVDGKKGTNGTGEVVVHGNLTGHLGNTGGATINGDIDNKGSADITGKVIVRGNLNGNVNNTGGIIICENMGENAIAHTTNDVIVGGNANNSSITVDTPTGKITLPRIEHAGVLSDKNHPVDGSNPTPSGTPSVRREDILNTNCSVR